MKCNVTMSNGGGVVKIEVCIRDLAPCMASAVAAQAEKAFRDVSIQADETGEILYSRYYDADFYQPQCECDEALTCIRELIMSHY